jgi:hypothetical protein
MGRYHGIGILSKVFRIYVSLIATALHLDNELASISSTQFFISTEVLHQNHLVLYSIGLRVCSQPATQRDKTR